jgi:DNA-binding response OmpR family regulator
MSRILLADDSPHAQRMGERILHEEGFEVVTVTDGETALIRLDDVDPDVVLADVFLPIHSGYELCQHVKSQPRHRHARVVLLAGLLEPVDEVEASRVGADAVLKKPFEASAVVALIRPLIEAAQTAREARVEAIVDEKPRPEPLVEPGPQPAQAPERTVQEACPTVDAERVRAAVTVALDRAMPAMIDEITERVLVALGQ